ncbi:hypothetical protein B0H11DRAFT_2249115 [Mycena galericulata]|nr:hypothetical protein B0H11DRAFT_2249115 [Mycena galericulata]
MMFPSSSGVHINGGNFYDIAGNMNVQSVQPLWRSEVLEIGSVEAGRSGRRLMGVERAQRCLGGGVRMLPYGEFLIAIFDFFNPREDISHRPRVSNNSSLTDGWNPTLHDYPLSRSECSLYEPHPLNSWGRHVSHVGQGSLSGLSNHHLGLENSRAVDYNPDAEPPSSSSEYTVSPSPSALVSFGPSSSPSRYPFLSPPDWAGDALSGNNAANYPCVYSKNFEQAPTTTVSEPRHFLAELPSEALASVDDLSFSWDRPLHEPGTSINGGTFISGNVNNVQRHGEAGLHILHRAITGDAFHDSAERYPQPQCHPDTRTKLLDVLQKWACGMEPPSNWTCEDEDDNPPGDDEDSNLHGDEQIELQSAEGSDDDVDSSGEDRPSSSILWLYGPAGSGKSAIAQSLCQQLQAEGLLGGSFFFKRGHPSRGNAGKLFPTIAYQLALILPEMHHTISQTVEKDPAIVHRSLSDQLQKLIIEPCRKVPLTQPVLIVIDGLDECEDQAIQQEILRSIGFAVQQPLSVLFFITSRPEPHITEVFDEQLLDGFHRALNIRESFDDVRKYLLDEFRRIHREHRTMATVSRPWPLSEVVDDLVEKSSGYFIYASTIIKYIDDKNFRPTERLEIILGIKERGLASPFDMLDQLYIRILSDVPLDSRSQLLHILTFVGSGYLRMTLQHLEELLELQSGDVRLILRNLHSIITLPERDDWGIILVDHTSFLDFIHDLARSGPFYVGGPQHRTDLVRYILKALAYKYDLHRSLVSECFQYISSAQPSPDFVPLLRSINPDVFFCFRGGIDEDLLDFFNWLKKFPVLCEDVIPSSEDYRFMLLCEQAWNAPPTELSKIQNLDKYHQVLLQVSPQLIRILRACKFFPIELTNILYRLHHLLDLSWDELRLTICSLRELVGEDTDRLQELFAFTLNSTLIVEHNFDSIVRDLVWGALYSIKGAISSGGSERL